VQRARSIRIFTWLGVASALLGLASLALIYERHDLLTWYAVRGLCRAEPQDRAGWIARLQADRERSVPALLARLRTDSPAECENVRSALASLAEGLGPEESSSLAAAFAKAFPSLCPSGQHVVLDVTRFLAERAEQSESPGAWAACQVLALAARTSDSNVRSHTLDLIQALVERFNDFEASGVYREVVRCFLHDELAALRIRAIRFALRPGSDLLDQVVPLLDDSVPEVRRAAMLVVGPSAKAIETEELLRWLHDPDEEVCKLCAEALRSRGLGEEHLRLGRLMTDPQPGSRLRVFDLLQQTTDLDLGVWLRRLSHDPSPAVRAAAVRAASEQRLSPFSDRLLQMAQNDPSQTIRQLAQYYLSAHRTRNPAQ
jgi:HEAT repeats